MRFLLQAVLLLFIPFVGCKNNLSHPISTNQIANVLNYTVTPGHGYDRSGLMYSDQGAWFAYSFPVDSSCYGGFSGPFLMTQENGVWSARVINQLVIEESSQVINWETSQFKSYNSHLKQEFNSKNVQLSQTLAYFSGHTAIIQSKISNTGTNPITLNYYWKSKDLLASSLITEIKGAEVIIHSSNSKAIGHLLFPEDSELNLSNNNFQSKKETITLKPGKYIELITSQSFVFPEYSWDEEIVGIRQLEFEEILNERISEKESQIEVLKKDVNNIIPSENLDLLITKAHLTLQNNWRIPAGELKHAGLFPSYHYKWFNGFWSWDSWKHAVGLSYYDPTLAKNQMRAMFDFQLENGFIVDCVFRDTLIEGHNFRDTKPPLAAWAVSNIYKNDGDIDFVKEVYPKLKKYHEWWYSNRDNDGDGLCEYGSTDGSLIAAKWESGMDNAIRFDKTSILKNDEGAYSMNQESVDLNSYLFAEKLYLAELAGLLFYEYDKNKYLSEAETLKIAVQNQFFDKNDGWFYDTDLSGEIFIKGEGSEGWTALWAKLATQAQAEAVMHKMMDPNKFFTRIPFQTLSADHEKFDPHNGYWRGPNWLDQAYFGIRGLHNYGFHAEAKSATTQLLQGADGILEPGISIRENYHPLTGKGLNAQNFSWSAAHLIMMLKIAENEEKEGAGDKNQP